MESKYLYSITTLCVYLCYKKHTICGLVMRTLMSIILLYGIAVNECLTIIKVILLYIAILLVEITTLSQNLFCENLYQCSPISLMLNSS